MKTVEKALDILEAILNHRGEVSLTDISQKTGLNRTTVYRLSSVLAKRGYLQRGNKRGKYSPGFKLLQYNNISNTVVKIKDVALPYLQKLGEEIDETVNLVMLNGIRTIDVAAVAAESILKVAPASQNSLPLHCTAIGKVLLASVPESKLDNILEIIGLSACTDNTITDSARLSKELETIKREGIAFDDEEYVLGVRSAAAPVKGEGGAVIAAISFVGPSVRISRSKMRQLAPKLKDYALKISLYLGYKD